PALVLDHDELWRFTSRFHKSLKSLAEPLLEAMLWETAFTRGDCEEVLQGSFDYVHDFRHSLRSIRRPLVAPIKYQIPGQERQIRLVSAPWGTVAAILPQSAFVITAVTCLLNALAAGNRVILRAPIQGARSAALLALAVEIARPPHDTISIVQVRSREFVTALNRSTLPSLIHYMGSSRYASQIHSDAFQHGNGVIIDGEGNTWVWVGEDADLDTAAEYLTMGAVRYNGQTCTSVNGAMLHPAIYSDLKEKLVQRWCDLKAGNPATEDVQVGPLLDDMQGEWCERRIKESGGKILCGGMREGNLLHPTLVEQPGVESSLVSDGLFGCAMWIMSGDQDDFVSLWPRNRFPLCGGVISPAADPAWWLVRLPNLARFTVNSDPSVEHIFEPWGGYPESGVNPVGTWREKYQRIVSIDEPLPHHAT
ncbi:MAG: aldehyde dehydrogenase family protein, partial [Abitibacteriaceae bacterium]|nr:aldehyde dehydrogenase family protein [Abditibacteriaceae bacterium]